MILDDFTMGGVLDFLGLGDSDEQGEGPSYGTDSVLPLDWGITLDQGLSSATPENTGVITQVFMKYMGDVDNAASGYQQVQLDDDGDYCFNFTIDQDVLDQHKFFLDQPGSDTLKRVSGDHVKLDKDKDVRIHVDGFLQPSSKPNMMSHWRVVPRDQVRPGNPVFNYSGGVHKFFDGLNWTVFAGPHVAGFGDDFFYTFA
jgi:hypothetical protein